MCVRARAHACVYPACKRDYKTVICEHLDSNTYFNKVFLRDNSHTPNTIETMCMCMCLCVHHLPKRL